MRSLRLSLVVSMSLVWAASDLRAQSFSLNQISPTVQTGNGSADDIFQVFPGFPPPVLPAPPIGYLGGGQFVEVDALSYGRTLNQFSTNVPAFFSVDIGPSGAAGTAASIEFNNFNGSEDSSDIFFSSYNSGNSLAFDGDGNGTAPNPNVTGLGVAEPVSYIPTNPPPNLPSYVGDIDGLDMRNPVQPANSPTGATFFSIDTLAASSGVYGPGISAADVFVGLGGGGYDTNTPINMPPASPGGVPQPYASEPSLGFIAPPGSNDIDALVVFDNGDNIYSPGTDIIVFSLAPGSLYLGTLDPGGSGLTISAGDILVDGATSMALFGAAAVQPSILHSAESLGLFTVRSGAASDGNLNALDLAVPEPGSLVLLLLGMAGLGLFGWRRTRPT